MSNNDFEDDFAASARRALMEDPGLGQGQRHRAQAEKAARNRKVNLRFGLFGAVLGVLIVLGNRLYLSDAVPYEQQTEMNKLMMNIGSYALFGAAIAGLIGFIGRDFKLVSFSLGGGMAVLAARILTQNL